MNGIYGGSVEIAWKIAMNYGVYYYAVILNIHLNNTKSIEIFQHHKGLYCEESELFKITDHNITKRSSAVFHSKGIVESQIYTAEVVLTINHLRLEDSNVYILSNIYRDSLSSSVQLNVICKCFFFHKDMF